MSVRDGFVDTVETSESFVGGKCLRRAEEEGSELSPFSHGTCALTVEGKAMRPRYVYTSGSLQGVTGKKHKYVMHVSCDTTWNTFLYCNLYS